MAEKTFKYDFFISYRHADPDLEIASYLHRLLEQYKIPKEIQKKSGKTKISRVFRDEDELSASSDLSQDIRNQLSNSEFLIVICSPNTRQSRWVEQEIRTFMEVRDGRHILPVLIEGEPEDSFPDILLETEPMAADFRGVTRKDIRKRCKSELLRLVAPALHCSYDELKQRHKTYQMQRVAIGASILTVIALLFFSYSTYQSIQIAKNYREKQENQARLLADKSAQLLEEADREAALLVAMEALPENEADDSMPLVGDAQTALENALYLYSLPEHTGYFPNRILHMQNYATSTYTLDKEARILATYDAQDILYFWDLDSEELISTYNLLERDLSCKDIFIISDQLALICTSKVVIAFHYTENEVVWEWSLAEEYSYINDFDLNPEKTLLACINMETVYDEEFNSQDYLHVSYLNMDGTLSDTVRTPIDSGTYISESFWAPDNNRLFIETYIYDKKENTELYAADLNNNSLEHYLTLPYSTGIANGNLEFAFSDESTLIYLWYELYPSWDYYYPVLSYHVHCMDINTQETLWQVDGEGVSRDRKPQISFLDITYDDGSTEILTTVNIFSEVINIFRGEIISETHYNGIISTVINQDPMQIHLSETGTLYRINIANGTMLNEYYGRSTLGVEDILAAEVLSEDELIIFKEDTGNIYLFNRKHDDSGLLFEGSEYASSSAIYSNNDQYVMNVSHDYDNDIETITLWESATGKIYYQDEIQLDETESTEHWGFFGNEYIYLTTAHDIYLYSISEKAMLTHYNYNEVIGNTSEYLEDMEMIQTINSCEPCFFFSDVNGDIIKLSGIDLASSIIFSAEAISEIIDYEDTGLNYTDYEFTVSPQGTYIAIYRTEYGSMTVEPTSLYLWNCEKQEETWIPTIYLHYEEYSSLIHYLFSDDDSHLLIYDNDKHVHSIDLATGTEQAIIDLEGDSYRAFWYSPDMRYIFLHSYDYLLKVYDTENQEYSMITDNIDIEVTSWRFYDDDQYLHIESDGAFTYPYQFMLRRIDDGEYEVFSTLSTSVSANKNSYLTTDDENGMYQYKRLSLDEMLAKAREFLGDRKLTELEKQKYNIED